MMHAAETRCLNGVFSLLTPAMCRLMHRVPPVADDDGLIRAMASHAEEADEVCALLTGHALPETTRQDPNALAVSLRACLTPQLLAFARVCRQCNAAELLSVLQHCTVPVTAEGAAILTGVHRQQEAQRLYGLQMLWRIHGDPDIPDALGLFSPTDVPSHSAEEIRRNIILQLDALKGGSRHE